MFKKEMTCTKVSCCCVHSCINEFTHCLISTVSFVVVVPISQCSASPKKGKLLSGHGLSEVANLSKTGSVLSSSTAVCLMGSYDL